MHRYILFSIIRYPNTFTHTSAASSTFALAAHTARHANVPERFIEPSAVNEEEKEEGGGGGRKTLALRERDKVWREIKWDSAGGLIKWKWIIPQPFFPTVCEVDLTLRGPTPARAPSSTIMASRTLCKSGSIPPISVKKNTREMWPRLYMYRYLSFCRNYLRSLKYIYVCLLACLYIYIYVCV